MADAAAAAVVPDGNDTADSRRAVSHPTAVDSIEPHTGLSDALSTTTADKICQQPLAAAAGTTSTHDVVYQTSFEIYSKLRRETFCPLPPIMFQFEVQQVLFNARIKVSPGRIPGSL